MPHRKIPTSNIIIPAGIRHFYRSANLAGLRLILWEDERPATLPMADYLREAGAMLDVIRVETASPEPPCMPPITARYQSVPPRAEEIAMEGIVPPAPLVPAAMLHVDAAVLNLCQPDATARSLQATGIPFVMFTRYPERCLSHYPAGSCVDAGAGPEALASAVLLHVAIHNSGLHCEPDMTVTEMLPKLRAMARLLVQDKALADDLVGDAMEQALAYLQDLASEKEIGALLVMLIERIWYQQKLSRLN